MPHVSAALPSEVCLLDLPQHLGFAHDQGVQTGGDAEQVPYCLFLAIDVEAVGVVIKAHAVERLGKTAEGGHAILLFESDQDELHPVTGGNDHRLLNFRFGLKPTQDLGDDSVI